MSVNKELSNIFREMSAIYSYIGGEERFRTLAYQKASRVIGNMQEDISLYKDEKMLKEIPGVGEGIAEKIMEYLHTGRVKKYEELKKSVPAELLEMMDITGFGPQTLKQIHEKLGVNTRSELVEALEKGEVGKLKGFGKKKVENMLRGLKLHKTLEERILLWNALQAGSQVVEELKKIKGVEKAELAGSIRRRKETIGDIDILVAASEKSRKRIVDTFLRSPFIGVVLAKGDTRVSIILKELRRQVDVRMVKPDEWGSALLYFTGSKEHNIRLRTIARDKGYKISEYGLFLQSSGKRVAGETEEGIYKTLGFHYIPPEFREDKGELTLAIHKMPRLVEHKDIRGDLQMHSTWSDGSMDIEELASYVKKNYNYDYIVLTDHSKSVRIAGGMNEAGFKEQIKAIDKLKQKPGFDFLKKGAEVDVLPNGTLDLDDDLLARLDWVCASIHSGLTRNNTERLLTACRHPLVSCIGHPSGRLIGQRDPYPVDWEKLMKTAAETGTALEINCQPERMDLNDELARMAREAGVALVISTDSHRPEQFALMELGVSIARRAGCRAEDILNTGSWKSLESFKSAKRNKVRKISGRNKQEKAG